MTALHLYFLVSINDLFASFLVGRGAHDWAISHGVPPCPSEKMATSEYFSTASQAVFSHDLKVTRDSTQMNLDVWLQTNQSTVFIYLFLNHTQSSVYLHISGTKERWSWLRKWTQDIIKQREDDNQVEM